MTAHAVAAGAATVLAVLLVTPAPAPADRVRPIEARSLELERRVVPYDGRSVTTKGEQVTVTLDADVLFAFDRADLTPAAAGTLEAIGTDLADRATGVVTVVGHTDALGDDAYNLDLSLRRAETVRTALEPVTDGAVGFAVEGRGEAEPVAANTAPDGSDDPEARRRNRRVELTYTVVEE